MLSRFGWRKLSARSAIAAPRRSGDAAMSGALGNRPKLTASRGVCNTDRHCFRFFSAVAVARLYPDSAARAMTSGQKGVAAMNA